jgi:hypothetical protein
MGAYVFGDLKWPMPDLGLIAVWRAMPLDGSKWGDWDGFVDDIDNGTIAGFLDALGTGAPANPVALEFDEHGAKLRAYLEDADCWKRLAIAWRAAADLGATGEFVWTPGKAGVAYHGVIGDYDSTWEKREATGTIELPGRKEIDAMLPAPPADDDEPAEPPKAATGKKAAAKPTAAKKKPRKKKR